MYCTSVKIKLVVVLLLILRLPSPLFLLVESMVQPMSISTTSSTTRCIISAFHCVAKSLTFSTNRPPFLFLLVLYLLPLHFPSGEILEALKPKTHNDMPWKNTLINPALVGWLVDFSTAPKTTNYSLPFFITDV